MNKLILLILISMVLISGCVQQTDIDHNDTESYDGAILNDSPQDVLKCSKGYVESNGTCCIDSDSDGLCDSRGGEPEKDAGVMDECVPVGLECCMGDICTGNDAFNCNAESGYEKVLVGCDMPHCLPVHKCVIPGSQPSRTEEEIEQYLIELDPCGNATGNGDVMVHGAIGPNDLDPDNPFRSLTVHPNDPYTVYVGTERNGFLKSTDGGDTWERKRLGLWHDDTDLVMWNEAVYPEIYDIAYSYSDPEIMYATTVTGPGPLVSWTGISSGVYKSTDGGETWVRKSCGLTSGWGWSIWVSPTNPDIALNGVSGGYSSGPERVHHEGGIFRTTDGGDTWVRINITENDGYNAFRVIASARDDPDIVYISGYDVEDGIDNMGFARSTDGGATWTLINSMNLSYFDVSSDGDTIYGTLEDDCSTIVRSGNGGKNWHGFRGSCYAVAVSPTDSKRVIYATSDAVYLSTNGLDSKREVLSLPMYEKEIRVGDIVFAPSNPDIVYIITEGYYFYRSTNGGENFRKIKNLRSEVLDVIQ